MTSTYLHDIKQRHSRMPHFMLVSGVFHILLVYLAFNFLVSAFNVAPPGQPGLIISLIDETRPAVTSVGEIKAKPIGKAPKTASTTAQEPPESTDQNSIKAPQAISRLIKEPVKNNVTTQQPRTESPLPAVTNFEPQLASAPVNAQSDLNSAKIESEITTGNKDSAETEKTVLKRINDELKKHISYPLLARKRGWAGKVTIGFQFTDNGLIRNIHLSKSSGYPLLDQSALHAFNQITHINFYKALHIDRWRVLQLPVEYRLIEG